MATLPPCPTLERRTASSSEPRGRCRGGLASQTAVRPVPTSSPERLRGPGADGRPSPLRPGCRCSSCPRRAVLGGRSAAAWFGAPFAGTGIRYWSSSRLSPHGADPRGVRVHRRDLGPHEVISVEDSEGLHPTHRPRSAPRGTSPRSRPLPPPSALLDAMVRAGRGTSTVLHLIAWARRAALGSRDGSSKVVPLVDGRSQSPPESWVRVACVRAGLPGSRPAVRRPGCGTSSSARSTWPGPSTRLIVEYEGAYHFDELQIRRDDRRYARLTRQGGRSSGSVPPTCATWRPSSPGSRQPSEGPCALADSFRCRKPPMSPPLSVPKAVGRRRTPAPEGRRPS